jgi:LacI family transcriptional regulator
MAVTIRDVAERAGLCPATVFRYLNGAQLREKNRLKVEHAIQALGFKADVSTIAFVVSDLADLFTMSIVKAIVRCLVKEKYTITISEFESDENLLEERLRFFKHLAIGGLILFPAIKTGKCSGILQEYLAERVPVVFVDETLRGFETDVVVVDNAHASFRAVEQLIQANHRKIAILNGRPRSWVSQERLRGYLEAMHTYDIAPEEQWSKWGHFTLEGGYTAVKEIFQAEQRPTAIYSTNYHMTLGAAAALNELQIKVPDEISFVGFDHFPDLDVIRPPLTLVEQPVEKIGEAAGELILKRIRGDYTGFPQKVELKTKMLLRDSVRKLE